MKKNPIRFSIVTIVFNGQKEIQRTIESVLKQDYPNIEYIIIDGLSNDGTMQIIKEYSKKIATIISEKDSGIYNAMNKGISKSQGDYVLFLNCGDCLFSEKTISEVAKQIPCNNLPDLIYGTYIETDNEKCISKEIPNRSYKKIWYGMFTSHQSIFYSLKHLNKYQLKYDESYKIAADYKLTLEFVKTSNNILQIPVCISKFDKNGISCLNPNLGLMEADRARKEVLKYSWMQRLGIILLLLIARFLRMHLQSIYKYLRYK